MGTLGGVSCALGTASPPSHTLAALGLAKTSRALASVGKAHLRLRDLIEPREASGVHTMRTALFF